MPAEESQHGGEQPGLSMSSTPESTSASVPSQDEQQVANPVPLEETTDGHPAPDPFADQDVPWRRAPQRRSTLAFVVLVLITAIIFGPAGYFVGRATPASVTAPSPSVSASANAPTPTLTSPFERAQEATNRRHLSPALQRLAEPWLPYVGNCTPSTAALTQGKKSQLKCRYGNVTVNFVEFASVSERDKARTAHLDRQVDARLLAPGVAARRDGPTPSGRTTGSYIESSYTATAGTKTDTIAALWWDDANTPIAAYLLAYWHDDLGSSWDPLRDLWSRYA